jgi:hypothetical protein
MSCFLTFVKINVLALKPKRQIEERWSVRAVAQAVSRNFPLPRPGFKPRSGHAEFVVNKLAMGQVFVCFFFEYFGFFCQFLFH